MPNIDPTTGHSQVTWQDLSNEASKSSWWNLFSSGPSWSLSEVRQSFESHFTQNFSRIAETVPIEQMPAFVETSGKLFSEIAQAAFEPSNGITIDRSRLRKIIKQANELADKSLKPFMEQGVKLPSSTATSDSRPQIVKTEGGKFNLIRKAPLLENLVLRGGGAKGIGYGPSLAGLSEHGLLDNLKHIVGTSAGALTAVGLASGLNAEKFARVADSIDPATFKHTPSNLATLYPGIDFGVIGYKAGNALQTLDQISARSVSETLTQQWNTEAFQKNLLKVKEKFGEEGVIRLAELRFQDFKTDRSKQMVTFKDLAMLHELDPGRFKLLTLTGWDNDQKKTVYFNSDTTPDMPVAVAGRISMSIPKFFKAVKFDPGDGEGRRTFVDGGVGSNLPSEAVRGIEHEETRAKTLLMTFDEQGKAFTILHAPPHERDALDTPNWLAKQLAGNRHYDETVLADREKAHAAGPNTFVVFHGDIGTLSLDTSPGEKAAARISAHLETINYIAARQHQAYAMEFDSVEDAFASLTDMERQSLLQADRPQNELEARLYDLARIFHQSDSGFPIIN